MKTSTAHSRLESLQLAAEECLTRDEAQKILRKADKAHAKLESSAASDVYKRQAELLNGRAAMIGFVVGVLTEALTGHGIVSQITFGVFGCN